MSEPRFGDLVRVKLLNLTYHGIVMSKSSGGSNPSITAMVASGLLAPMPLGDVEIVPLQPGGEASSNFAEIIIPMNEDDGRPLSFEAAKASAEADEHLRQAFLAMIPSNPTMPGYDGRLLAASAVVLAGRLQRLAMLAAPMETLAMTIKDWLAFMNLGREV